MGDEASTALPTGTVTFLLTDVEGSTVLWETRAAEMRPAIQRHYEILDEAVARVGGQRPVEQGEGDSIVAVFTTAHAALAAAVDAQRQLARELPWLPVRMAMHTGEALLRDAGNYVGPTIIRCARLRGCGHGGQLLVSEVTAGLCEDAIEGVTFREVGTARLKGMARPERVWQACHPDLAAEFPPLRSGVSAPTNVPADASSFVGREDELAAVRALLGQSRVVTLAGTGGCGKTRLAQRAAHDRLDEHVGGVWWVELASSSSQVQVVDRVADAVGVVTGSGSALEQALVDRLRMAEPTLLVLDNAEHVIDEVARLVAQVVGRCPSVSVLVTSREPLGVVGEAVFRVPSLAVPVASAPSEALQTYAAVRLFVDRMRDARSDAAPTAADLANIATICRRVDGLPLAVELAAARVRSMPLARIADGLDSAFRLLTGGARTAAARQQTLHASILWSTQLLEPLELKVFERLAVFPAPFSLEAAEAVVGDGDVVDPLDVLDLLGRLVDKSLVHFDPQTDRYHLLETLRQFGVERLLANGELEVIRRRHCKWVVDWCAALGRWETGTTFSPSHECVPHVLAALGWAYDAEPPAAYAITDKLGSVRAYLGHESELDVQFAWLVGRDGSDDPVGWARAIAAVVQAGAGRMLPDDFTRVAARARPHLADDQPRLFRLDLLGLLVAAARGISDSGALEAAMARAVEMDDALGVQGAASILMIQHAGLGRFDQTLRVSDDLRRYFEARRLPYDAVTARTGYASPLLARLQLGRLGEVVEMLAAIDRSRASRTALHVLGSMAAAAAWATGDTGLLDRAETWVTDDDSVLAGWARHHVACFRGLRDTNLRAAATAGMEAVRLYPLSIGQTSYMLRNVGPALLGLGDVATFDVVMGRFSADVAHLGMPPLPAADDAFLSALRARHDGDDPVTVERGAAAVSIAHGIAAALLLVDALEVEAEALMRLGESAVAARLFGAAAAQRARMGYVGRAVPDPEIIEASVEQCRRADPSAFAEGQAAALAAVVDEAVRRGRGRRPG